MLCADEAEGALCDALAGRGATGAEEDGGVTWLIAGGCDGLSGGGAGLGLCLLPSDLSKVWGFRV